MASHQPSDFSETGFLRRLQALDELLPTLAGVLDVREVFARISEIAQQVLPHDMMALPLLSADKQWATIHAAYDAAHRLPRFPDRVPVTEAHRRRMEENVDYHIFDDITPEEFDLVGPPAQLGFRSLMRLAVRLQQDTVGALDFASFQPHAFTPADALLGRRIADQIAMALSHQRLAEESRRAAALQERTANLEMLDGLLSAVTDVLDIREIFHRVSEIAGKILPHDAMGIPIVTDDREHLLVHATAGYDLNDLGIIPIPESVRRLIDGDWDFDIIDDLGSEPQGPGRQRLALLGFCSALRAPIRIGGQVAALLSFFSRQPAFYKPADAVIARRIANHVAMLMSHQRLAEESRRAAALQERTANLEMLDGLLSAVTDVLDVREIFDRVSEVAGKVLAHDAMGIPVVTDDRDHMLIYATKGLEVSDLGIIPIHESMKPLINGDWDFDIVDDLRSEQRGLGPQRLALLGFRSVLRAPIRIGGQVAALLSFFSRKERFYTAADAIIARRIASHVAMLMSHHRLADESRRAAELKEREANLQMLDELLRTLADALDIRDVFEQVSTVARKVLPHDMIALPMLTDDRKHFTVYARAGGDLQQPETMPLNEKYQSMMEAGFDYVITPDLQADAFDRESPPAQAGYRSHLLVPIRVNGRLVGGMAAFSRQPNVFTAPDVLVARRIADHVALALSHHRLADESRRAAALKERAANLEMLDDLLKTLAGVLDIREVFEQVSRIAQKVLPHDLLALPMVTEDRKHITLYAIGGGTMQVPEVIALREHHAELVTSNWDYLLMPDLQLDVREKGMPPYEAGYRGRLCVPIRVHGELLGGLDVFSFQPNAYTQADVLIARRIADHVALALSHQRLAEEAQRVAEARERAALLERRVDNLTAEVQALGGHRRVIGESKAWKDVLKQATQVAATETTVLLLGDSGTGKEVVARFIHRASTRSGGPFVALNCAALPEQLLESELFGYERGAFTGALNAKPGQIEQASGGVLFLDEVSEMSLSAQAKFLRVLQEKEFQRLGGTRVMKANARVIAATNRDLQTAIERGTFREDLYYRLHVFEIALPRLRDRPDDVLPLSEAFLEEIARGFGRPPAGISREARRLLVDYHWPGNVRQLRNTLERAAILCEGGLITGEHLSLPGARPIPVAPPAAAAAAPAAPPAAVAAGDAGGDLKSLERAAIEKALRDAKHNKSKAAKLLGLTRTQLYVRLRKYGLES